MKPVPNRAPKRSYQVERAGTTFPAMSSKQYEATDFNSGKIYPGVTAAHAEKRLKEDRVKSTKRANILRRDPEVAASALGMKGESSGIIMDNKKYRNSAVDAVRSNYNKAGTKVRKSGK